jgi:positive regulator of sigma E activity
MVAVQLLLTPVLTADRIRLIMVVLVGGLAAWWVARHFQKAAPPGDTPVNPV